MYLECIRKAENADTGITCKLHKARLILVKHLDCHCQDVTCSAKTHLSMLYILLVKLCGTGPKHFSREIRDRTKCHWWSEVRSHVLSKLSIKIQWKTLRIKRSGTRDLNVKVHFIIIFLSAIMVVALSAVFLESTLVGLIWINLTGIVCITFSMPVSISVHILGCYVVWLQRRE